MVEEQLAQGAQIIVAVFNAELEPIPDTSTSESVPKCIIMIKSTPQPLVCQTIVILPTSY